MTNNREAKERDAGMSGCGMKRDAENGVEEGGDEEARRKNDTHFCKTKKEELTRQSVKRATSESLCIQDLNWHVSSNAVGWIQRTER